MQHLGDEQLNQLIDLVGGNLYGPDLALRFEVVDGVIDPDGDAAVLLTLVSGVWDSERMVQVWSRVVGRRTYRAIAIFPPELEGDAVIRRFMQSVRYYDGSN